MFGQAASSTSFPARLVGDMAYDSDPLDRTLQEEYRIEMIPPQTAQP